MKSTLGTVVIVLLTPVAVGIALCGSCTATYAFLESPTFGQNYLLVFVVGWSIFLIPPAAVLVGMIWWAVLRRSQSNRLDRKPDRAK
jgi:hypothetical protein